MNKFANWLLQQMEEKKWSQADLANEAGLTRSTISYYLSPKSKNPDPVALNKIAHALKLPPELVYEKAGLLIPKSNLSPIKRKLIHIAQDLPDSDIELALGLLENRADFYKKHPEFKPSK